MVRHLIYAIVRHISNGDAQLCRCIDGDIVHAHAIASYHHALLCRSHNLVRNLREAGQNAVGILRERGERVFLTVRRDHEFRAYLSEHGTLRFHRGPDIISYQNLE